MTNKKGNKIMKIEKIITDLKCVEVDLRSKIEQVEYWKNESKRLEKLCIKYKVPYRQAPKKKTFNK